MVVVVGAGMAGLLAARKLRDLDVTVMEAQPSLPNNHSAVLRFRSDSVQNASGIRFRKVEMIKDTLPWKNPVADAMAYSFKCLGVRLTDRSITEGLVRGDRYIAPENFIPRLAMKADILFDRKLVKSDCGPIPIISTIPMPALMEILDYPNRENILFRGVPGLNITATVAATNSYATLMIPSPEYVFSRISITGSELIIEVPSPENCRELRERVVVAQAARIMGIPLEHIHSIRTATQRYSKIMQIDEDQRKQFMFWATDNFGVYSLGRYATWRPGLLLDDLVHDIDRIEEWITNPDRYAVRKAR